MSLLQFRGDVLGQSIGNCGSRFFRKENLPYDLPRHFRRCLLLKQRPLPTLEFGMSASSFDRTSFRGWHTVKTRVMYTAFLAGIEFIDM